MSEPTDEPKTSGGPKLITHQVPIRPDLIVPITLPVRMTRADADRLAKIVDGLAFDDDADGGGQ